jgi:hypothetical protein
MVSTTVVVVYALGMIFAPSRTRAVSRALCSVLGMLTAVLFVFWRIFPTATGATFRRF